MREYVITKIKETPQRAEHAIVTMDGVEVYWTYFEQGNWPQLLNAAVLASKHTAAWFDAQSALADLARDRP